MRRPRRRPMIVSFAVCIILGVMTSITVSWWLALRDQHPFNVAQSISANPGTAESVSFWFADHYRFGFRMILVDRQDGPLDSDSAIRIRQALATTDHTPRTPVDMPRPARPLWVHWLEAPTPDDPPMSRTAARASGWPWLCFSSRRMSSVNGPPKVNGEIFLLSPTHYKVAFPMDWGAGSVPTLPIWSGLAANTTVFAAAWFLFVVCLTNVRRLRPRLRRRRGHCEVCGYDRHGLPAPACPECGHAPSGPTPLSDEKSPYTPPQ
jgi:hypothetical protein